MRLIYFGTGSFAIPALEALREHVALVVTQPDRPSGRGLRLQPSPVKLVAERLGLVVETPERSRSPEFVERLASADADALVVASYGQILSQAVLDCGKRGGFNLHGSILPKYRGAAPIQRSILNGEHETGITLIQMDKGMDTGDIIDIVKTPLNPDETYSELQDRLALIAAEMASTWMTRLVGEEYPRTKQDNTSATIAPKVQKEEAEMHFSNLALDEYNRFRGFTDSPGAFLTTRLGSLRVHRARCVEDISADPGTVLPKKAELRIAFRSGAIDLMEVQLEGKKRMAGRDFANGARLRPGDSLER